METAFVIGLAWNTGLFAVVGYMVKRWMDKQESADAKNDLELYRNLHNIYDQLRVANGRTAASEGDIQTIKAICAERHEK